MSNKISELESTVESLNGMIKSLREEIESLRRANGVLRDEILSHGGDSMALVQVDASLPPWRSELLFPSPFIDPLGEAPSPFLGKMILDDQ